MSVSLMCRPKRRRREQLICSAIATAAACAFASSACATSLRIVSYNIDDADQGNDNNITQSYAGLPSVLQAIGQHHIGTNAQPIDVLGVEELNSTTLQNLVNAMNATPGVGAGTYAFDPTTDPNTGGGPDGIIYNTHTVQIINASAIGTVSTTGAARAPMRYQIRPIGYGANADFYMYVSHYKASTGTTNQDRRNVEAATIRTDADALGASAHVIYSGDFNLTSGSSEPAWATLIAAGNGQAVDPTNSGTWSNSSSTYKYLYSESTTSLSARFDFQLVTNAMLNQPGVQLAPDTSDPFTGNFPSSKYQYAYEVFGNNNTTALNGLTNASGNTSLNDLANPTTILNDLMEPYAGNNNQFMGSDHLPVVADYNVVGVTPAPVTWTGGVGNWSSVAKWNTGLVPNHPGVEVFIDAGNATVSPVTLDQDATVQDLTLDAADSLTINATRTLTIAGPNGSTLNGAVTNNGTIAIQSGTTQALAGVDGSGSITIASGATLTAGHLRVGTLTVTGTARVTANGTSAATSKVATLSIPVGGKLDLSNNKLIVTSTPLGTRNGTTYTGVLGMVQSGRASGSWSGSGIDTSQSPAATGLTALAVATAGSANKSTFGGISVNPSDVLVMYTYAGDANLDGRLNGDDYFALDSQVNVASAFGWTNGDFNYDTKINGDDYFILDSNFNNQTLGVFPAGESGGSIVAVPEPAAALMASLLLSLAPRRIRRG